MEESARDKNRNNQSIYRDNAIHQMNVQMLIIVQAVICVYLDKRICSYRTFCGAKIETVKEKESRTRKRNSFNCLLKAI